MVDPDELRRHRRALRILVVVLIPLAIWTLVGLIAFWPGDISRQVNPDVAGYNVPGVTYPSARITGIKEISCDGLPGSTPGVTDARCAELTSQLLEGDDKGKAVTVPLTDAIYSSGVKVGQVIKLIRVPPIGDQPAQYQFSDFERRTPLLVLRLIFAAVVDRGRSLARLRLAARAGLRRLHPGQVHVPGTGRRVQPDHGRADRLLGDHVRRAVRRPRLQRPDHYRPGGHPVRADPDRATWVRRDQWAHLTGVAAEEDFVLAAAAPDLRLTSVVLCGIIVAGLGVLNDVTITQASAVWELADEGCEQRHLFSKAMRIGRDHIASTVYTIAFATAGASLSCCC